jgi:aryl-alcohol dehydrogenase-like predicted oxidoreductase
VEYRVLGRSGIKVSQLCLGTASFGRDTDDPEAASVFAACREAGINFFDTSNVYADGRSEEMLGRLTRSCRDEVILATKVCFPTSSNLNDRGLSRRHIRLSVEQSLRHLNTDFIDLYYAHNFDPDTPIEETLSAFDDLVREGKVMCIGASNWAAWQIAKALGISARGGFTPFCCLQPMYNLVKRQAEVEILPLARADRLAVAPFNVLAGGLLTGKYGVNQRTAEGRLTRDTLTRTRYQDERNFEVADRLGEYAESVGTPPATAAIAWVMSNEVVTSPIVGVSNEQQLGPWFDALKFLESVGPDWREELTDVSDRPPPATDRSEEREGVNPMLQ